MPNQDKKFRSPQDFKKQPSPGENPEQLKQQTGSRLTEAEKSREQKPSQADDVDILDDEDEDNVY